MRDGSTTPTAQAGYAGHVSTKAPPWHGLVAWDVLFNGLATGLFMTAAAGELANPAVFQPLAIVAYPIALVFLLIDLVLLVLDLGDPLRFHHMLRVFKPGSPMSVGTWSLTVFSLPLTVAAAISLLEWPMFGWAQGSISSWMPTLNWVRLAAVVLGLIPALASAVYKGVLLSTNAQPGWKDARWLGGYLTGNAPLLGCTVLVALAVGPDDGRALVVLRAAWLALLVWNLLTLGLLIGDLQRGLGRAPAGRKAIIQLLGLLAAGEALPLLLVLASNATFVLLTAAALTLLGGALVRFVIVFLPHH